MAKKYCRWHLNWLLLALLLCQPMAWSQADQQAEETSNSKQVRDTRRVEISSRVENGLTHITFATVDGNVIASLPAEIVRGDKVWGTVTLVPTGQTLEDKRDRFKTLKNLLVQLKPENGSAIMMAPGCNPMVLQVPRNCSEIKASVYDSDDKSLSTYRLPVFDFPSKKAEDGQARMPQVATPKRYFRCGANTDGSPGKSACMIGDQNCPLVAGSPRDQWFATPEDLPSGPLPIKLYLPDTQQVAESQVSVVRPKISADKLLRVGDRGQVKISVEGLQPGRSAQVIFRNLSPDVVTVGGGDYQVLNIGSSK